MHRSQPNFANFAVIKTTDYVGGPNTLQTNLRWRTFAIFKSKKIAYLCNILTDFDEIWHDDASRPS